MNRKSGAKSYIAENIKIMPTSGIRKFFDVANMMEDVVSLGVGEPDFHTPWHASEAGILSIERGQTAYTSNQGMPELRDAISVYLDEKYHTTLAFVHTYPDGDRDFSFYRDPGADMMLTKDEVQKELIESSRIFHFGTLSSTHEGVREATRHAIELAKEAGCIITFDPNLRPPLWKSLDDARAEIEYGMSKCDVLKISDNEVEFMCGTTDYDKGAAMIQEKYNIPLILITLGKDGSRAYYKNMRVEAAPFLQENTIETTGAGDTFCASTLNYVLDHGLNDLTEENLKELLTFANAAASLITTRKGALRVMPTREEVEAFIESRK